MYYDLKESGKRIRELRETKGYTQEGLADKIGLTQKTVAAIENGRRGTTIDTLVALAEVFNTSLDYIVVGKEGNRVLNNMFEGLDKSKQDMAIRILKGILDNI